MSLSRPLVRGLIRPLVRPLVGGRFNTVHPDVVAYAEAVGLSPSDSVLAGTNALVQYLDDQSLLSSACFLPLKDSTGSLARVIGGLTSGGFTLNNGPSWVSFGGVSLNGSNQYLSKTDFLGAGDLLVLVKYDAAVDNDGTHNTLFAQWEGGTNQRSTWMRVATSDDYGLFRDSVGDSTGLEFYVEDLGISFETSGISAGRFTDGGGLDWFQNGTKRTLSLQTGSPQSSRANQSALVTLGCINASGSPSRLFTGNIRTALIVDGASVSDAQIQTLTTLSDAV